MPNSDENKNINEVIVNGETLLSTRGNTVTEDTLAEGETAQDKSGKTITGNMQGDENSNAYLVTDSLSKNISYDDYIPYYDVSEQKKHNTLIGKFVDFLKGIFITGSNSDANIYLTGQSFTLKMHDIDASEPDNNVDEINYPSTANILDSEGRIITRFESVVNPNGSIGAKIYVRNYDEEGQQIGQKGISFRIDKSGNLTYTIDNPNGFRQAINTIDQQGIEIPNNANLDSYKTAGTYKVVSDSSAQTMTNIPTNVCGKLVVFDNNNGGYEQFYFSNHTPRIYIRTWWSNAWSAWADITASGKTHTYEDGTQIPADSDLNNYKTEGVYNTVSNVNTATLLNCPTEVAGQLIVSKILPSGNYQIQYYIDYLGNIYVRRYDNLASFWSDWSKLSKGAHTYEDGTQIPADSDLNNYKTEGVYFVLNSNDASTILNLPIAVAGKLLVLSRDTYIRCFQIYIGGASNIYIREMDNNSVWGDWEHLASTDILEEYALNYGLKNIFPWDKNEDIFSNNTAYATHTITDEVVNVTIGNEQAVSKGVYIYSKRINEILSEFDGQSITVSCDAKYDDVSTELNFGFDGARYSIYTVGTDWTHIEKTFTYDASLDNNHWHFYNSETKNLVLHIKNLMIRPAILSNSTYADYALTNKQTVYALGASLAKTGKNILPVWEHISNTSTANGITYTFNPTTGTITLNGTATVTTDLRITSYLTNNIMLPKGKYILSGCPLGGSTSKYYLFLSLYDGVNHIRYDDVGFGCTITLNKQAGFNSATEHGFYAIRVIQGQTVSNLVFKPMLRPAWTTSDYEPCEDIHKGNCYIGTCSTAGATKDKVAYVDGFFVLRKGVKISIKFTNTNTYSNATANPITLNVNNTGAKNIWFNTTHSGAGNTGTTPSIYGLANRYIYYVYDGTYWVWESQSYYSDNSNYLPLTGGTMSGGIRLGYAPSRMITSGAYMPSVDDTLVNIINELRLSNGSYGSFNLKSAYTSNYTTIPVGWYNYFYIPHRIGGENWQTPTTWDSDNVFNGTLLLYGMNNTNGMFRIRINNQNSTATIVEVENLQKGNCYVGTCTTAANERAKVVTVDDNFVLRKGVRIAVKFTNTNTYENVTANPITLNVNGTGAKNIWFNSTHSGAGNTGTSPTIYGQANRYIYFVYDSAYWVWDGQSYDNDSTNFLRNDASTTLYAAGDPFINIKSSTIDIKQANNGVTSTSYPAYITTDKNGFGMSRLETVVNTDGMIWTYLQVRNYRTSDGGNPNAGFRVGMDKEGIVKYVVSFPANHNAAVGFGYGTCTTAANERIKVVTLANFVLTVGGIIGVKFTNTNTYSATADNKICLNVNGTGEKPIYYDRGYPTGTMTGVFGFANRVIFYMYDGTNWCWLNYDYESDTTYSNMSLSELLTGTATNDRTLRASILNDGIQAYGTAFGSCESTADTVNKIVTLADSNWTLRVGAIIGIKFSVSNTASSVTLNVNNTGAKSIYYNNGVYTGSASSVCGYANRVCYYMYDGTYWVFLHNGIVDSNTTYTPQKLGFGYGTCATAEATTAKVATLSSYSLVTNGIVAIKFTYAVPANATLNINSAGAKPIYFRGAAIIANIIKAGDIATFIYNGSQYHLISIDFTSKTASSNGTDLSLVTTGEKATWNSKTSNVGTVTSIATGVGLTGGAITGSGTIKANLKTETPSTLESAAMTSTASRQYPVVLDKDGYLSVNVPWSYSTITAALIEAGTSTSARLITAKLFRTYIDNKTWMGTCETAAATAAKEITVDNGFLLAKGARIGVKFTYSNTAESVTLNVNSTGDKSIYYNNAVYASTGTGVCGYANRYNYYVYDGTYWVWDGHGTDADTTYSPRSLGFGYGTCTTEAATTAKVATLSSYNLVTGGYVSIKFSYDVPASATLNINSEGDKNIYYRGAAIKAGVIKAGDIATFVYSTRYHLVGIDRDNLKVAQSNDSGIISGYTAGTNIVVDKMYVAKNGDIVTLNLHFHASTTISLNSKDYVIMSGFDAPLNYTNGIALVNGLLPFGCYIHTNGNLYIRKVSASLTSDIAIVSLTYIKA